MNAAIMTALPWEKREWALMKLSVRTAAAGVVLAATAVLAAPVTASADDPKDGGVARCSEGKVCLFDGQNNTGDVLQLDPVDIRNIGWAWNDRAGSVWNRSDRHVCVWTDENFRGLNWIIEPGHKQELLFLYDNAVTSVEAHYGYGCGG
ncbi:hypothetical protein CP967_03070 [Streptomyces nitrosporeus]|uniref:Peptidase inhibitor family I36 protein n=2 Tax=Streptomyces nitrosporeus TaxID=28894 RepID=A0A5J6F4X9_9ACTN|nr:hypothetical protein CP967_03070 [Streptomyces nitrosporeus]GGZ14881.1 hypothetical protein GCM10010327_52310 [Streptomyces nitrosporeus]